MSDEGKELVSCVCLLGPQVSDRAFTPDFDDDVDDDDDFKITWQRGIVATPSPPAGIICKRTETLDRRSGSVPGGVFLGRTL